MIPFLPPNIHLTNREAQILDLIAAQGLPRKQVAGMADIDLKTVDYYIAVLKRKFQARTPAQLGFLYAEYIRNRRF